MPIPLQELAGRVPQRWRRRVPMGLRNRLVDRFGHPPKPFDPLAFPTRVNLGSGWDNRPGYLNVDLHDFHSPDLVGDVRALTALPSGRYEEVIAQDILEHLERDDVPVALKEWRRLLAPGGRLWLRVPDLEALLRWLQQDDTAERHREIMHFLFGTQAYNGDYHHAGFTGLLLSDELHRAGFERVELEIRDDWLWEGEGFARTDGAGPPVAAVWNTGFYRREHGADGSSWRWAAGEAELLLYADAATPYTLELTLETGSVQVTGVGIDRALSPGAHALDLELATGANRLRFVATELQDLPEDARELGFRLG
ncbi:methyltransferase domain-containing protein [Solirubrobacter phytolaccae]|uniref:Methyltransferase domain-containing protein n=1 Tax=Solirubrobacter phytolaccae TaxID=1404360 RepID=A0A9X3SCC7_9ACTN|nr:methyltransferase domain-containing protein [Solirubrobacter phytolaccae]MDA0182375.1 methyltransferase domain-containing protein [Solirubrobacter phytolaccae]